MAWNYRIMRHAKNGAAIDETFYAIHEVYYEEDDTVSTWTQAPCGSPFGATLEDMAEDFAWIAAALDKPVLDFESGKEVEPKAMLADDIFKVLQDRDILQDSKEVVEPIEDL